MSVRLSLGADDSFLSSFWTEANANSVVAAINDIASDSIEGLGSAPVVASVGAIADLTSGEQLLITTGVIVTLTDGTRWQYSSGSKILEASYVQLSDVTPPWSAITGKPDTLAGFGITDGITAAAVAAGYQPLAAELTRFTSNGTVAAATNMTLASVAGRYVTITHSSTTIAISRLGACTAGTERVVRFSFSTGSLSLTHNNSYIALPGNASMTVTSGDTMVFRATGSDAWTLVEYLPASRTGSGPAVYANSPTFGGTPSAPTPAEFSSSGVLATTYFVERRAPKVIYVIDEPARLALNGSTARIGDIVRQSWTTAGVVEQGRIDFAGFGAAAAASLVIGNVTITANQSSHLDNLKTITFSLNPSYPAGASANVYGNNMEVYFATDGMGDYDVSGGNYNSVIAGLISSAGFGVTANVDPGYESSDFGASYGYPYPLAGGVTSILRGYGNPGAYITMVGHTNTGLAFWFSYNSEETVPSTGVANYEVAILSAAPSGAEICAALAGVIATLGAGFSATYGGEGQTHLTYAYDSAGVRDNANPQTAGPAITITANGAPNVGGPSAYHVIDVTALGTEAGFLRIDDLHEAAPYICVVDEKSNSTAGGAATAGATVTRELNTVRADTHSLATLSSNQVTLPAGTYRFRFSAPGYNCNAFAAWLHNVTDVADVTGGQGVAGYAYNYTIGASYGAGRFTIAGSKAFSVKFNAQGSDADGLGRANFTAGIPGPSVFTMLEFWKE